MTKLAVGDRLIMSQEDAQLHQFQIKPTENAAMMDKEKDIVKGFEVSKNSYVVVTEKEIEEQKPESSSVIQIDGFVPIQPRSTPIYFDSSYYLAADSAVKKQVVFSLASWADRA